MLLAIVYFGMNTAVSYVLKSMVPQVPVVKSSQAVDRNSQLGSISSSTPLQSQESNEKKEVATSQGTESQSMAAPEGSPRDKEAAASSNQAQSESPIESPQAGTANSQSPTPKAMKDGFVYQPQVTTEKGKAVEESISLKEKAAVTSVLLKKLSASDLQLFAKMAGSGISDEEKKKAKEIILKKLSEDEYNELIQIAAKYGLSQGKNYQDSQKESHK